MEEWALKLIKECAEKCIPDGNPVVAKIKIQDIFYEICPGIKE